jgi:anhydro-N-acetylmuramic acid kinase
MGFGVEMRVLGMISGTSFDGVDYFIGDFALDGATVTMRRCDAGAIPYSTDLHARLVRALPPLSVTAADWCIIDTLVGQEFAAVAAQAMAGTAGVELISSHGQTVYHWVDGSGRALGTLQAGNPAWIAERSGLPVVSDLRSRDVVAGGQGAPLVSLLDVLLLGGEGRRLAAVNLGGISNVTVVGPDIAPLAYDIGPANALLDAVMVAATDGRQQYDADAALTRTGTVQSALLAALLEEPYYAKGAPKSTGKELFNLAYLERIAGPVREASLPDLLATLTELTAVTVMRELNRWQLDRVYFGGGGTANPVMMERMRALATGVTIDTMDSLGIDPREKEPALFALMGFLTMHGLPANVPSCTGASTQRLLGSITPGAQPLVLPAPSATAVTRLRVL